jgi:hypothetical protein
MHIIHICVTRNSKDRGSWNGRSSCVHKCQACHTTWSISRWSSVPQEVNQGPKGKAQDDLVREISCPEDKVQWLLLVSWVPGAREAHHRVLPRSQRGSQEDSNQLDHHGGVLLGTKNATDGQRKWYIKWYHFVFTSVCTPPQLSNTDMVILDSGCTLNFLKHYTSFTNVQFAQTTLTVNMANGNNIKSSHISELILMTLPAQGRKAQILPGLAHNSFYRLVNYATRDVKSLVAGQKLSCLNTRRIY